MQMKNCPHDSFSNKLQHIIIQAFEKYPEPIHVPMQLSRYRYNVLDLGRQEIVDIAADAKK